MWVWQSAATVGCIQITGQLQMGHVPAPACMARSAAAAAAVLLLWLYLVLLWQAVQGIPGMLQISSGRDQAQRDTALLVCL
jgi:hypothetical protein